MNEHNALNEDKMADIETRAITDTATRWCVAEKLVDEMDDSHSVSHAYLPDFNKTAILTTPLESRSSDVEPKIEI